jgi:hypothetical protein
MGEDSATDEAITLSVFIHIYFDNLNWTERLSSVVEERI